MVILKLIAVLIFAAEVILSHIPGERSGAQSQSLSRLTHIPESFLRRAAHVVLFFALSVSFAFAWEWYGIVGAMDEVTKIPILGRHCSAMDIGLNLLGTWIGMLLYVVL